MFKGAAILAVGFALGYAKALQENEKVIERLASLREGVDMIIEAAKETEIEVRHTDEVEVDSPGPDNSDAQ